MLCCGSVEVASSPSIFARLASLLAPHAEPNPVVWLTQWGGGLREKGGAQQGHLGIPSATRLWLRLFHSWQPATSDYKRQARMTGARGSPDVSDDAEVC